MFAFVMNRQVHLLESIRAKWREIQSFLRKFTKMKSIHDINEENKTFKFEKRHVSATPVPSSVCGWNNNDVQYTAEN